MKVIDLRKFLDMIHPLGYRLKHDKKHHIVYRADDPEQRPVARLAVHHEKGGKAGVLSVYAKRVMDAINQDRGE